MLLAESDDSLEWRGINWRGNLNNASKDDVHCPTDDEFRRHLESVLNLSQEETHDVDTNTTIPVLDPVITDVDVKRQINKLKPCKARAGRSILVNGIVFNKSPPCGF
ncbi:hypothetical protein E2C01_083319 [Portunus trituberculatus]|uniref:Uncharacterized protein n=1 Tax=Portunus trituberculatus TaxID=210409 RepID=A0A5B7J4B8_PORTR|nr:hypothetical protein [Portunus trituberculatus]